MLLMHRFAIVGGGDAAFRRFASRLVSGSANLSAGWGCGVCRVYNGLWRTDCKRCGRGRGQLLPDASTNESIALNASAEWRRVAREVAAGVGGLTVNPADIPAVRVYCDEQAAVAEWLYVQYARENPDVLACKNPGICTCKHSILCQLGAYNAAEKIGHPPEQVMVAALVGVRQYLERQKTAN